jgi:ATP-dependent RNA helicase HelY
MRIHTEMDLVAAECLRAGLWNELDASELAAVLSVLVFEGRRADDSAAPRLPGGIVKDVVGEMVHLWARLDSLEKEHRLDFLREPDMGFAWAAYRWAEGDELDDVLRETGLAAGDFVRWTKQLLDLTDQVAAATGDGGMRTVAREAGARMRRGVVAFSTLGEED